MSLTKETAVNRIDLMASEKESTDQITLHDFCGLTNGLPDGTPLMAIVVDDDEMPYTRKIVSVAIRCERDRNGKTMRQIEFTVQSDR